jgi:hypothetical protein
MSSQVVRIDDDEEFDPRALPAIDVGFDDDPESLFIELSIPDTSDPPFPKEGQDAAESGDLEETLQKTLNKAMHPAATQMLKMGKGSFGDSDANESTDVVKAAQELLSDIQNHYYYEERALQLNFSVRNKELKNVRDVRIELGFPIIEDFDIADRVYTNPFDKSSSAQASNVGYPEVEKLDKAIFVRSTIGVLEPNIRVTALRCPLRMALGPAAQRKKIAILYKLRRKEHVIGQGRLKIQFGRVTA